MKQLLTALMVVTLQVAAFSQCALETRKYKQDDIIDQLDLCSSNHLIIQDGVTVEVQGGNWDLTGNGTVIITIQAGGTLKFTGSHSILLNNLSSLVIQSGGSLVEINQHNRVVWGEETWSSSNFGTLIAQGGVGPQALPVELSSFAVERRTGYNMLVWTTVSEIDNDGFYIQVSGNGKSWDNLDWVNGNGNAVDRIDYSYKLDPIATQAYKYVRLKQVDFDGAYEYSRVLELPQSNMRFSIYPNPTSDYITISGVEGQVKGRIYDQMGQVVKTFQDTNASISLLDVSLGTYILEVENNGSLERYQIIKR